MVQVRVVCSGGFGDGNGRVLVARNSFDRGNLPGVSRSKLSACFDGCDRGTMGIPTIRAHF